MADRARDLGALLDELHPDLLIDAAGPFQASGYAVPLACATRGIAYLDLADARDFVADIEVVDAAAKKGGVAVITGASSVPALSGAVARHLAQGLDRVDAVDISISASNRATAGPSVARAILSYVGRPVRLWRGRRWVSATGWQDLRRESYAVTGEKPLHRRLVALADIPDHQLLPDRLPGRPAVTFRAGTELSFQVLALWLLSWPVRWGWVRSASGAARLVGPLQRLTARFGTDRSAMKVRLAGLWGEEPVERTWTLVASDGDGPEIPTLAATLLAERILAGVLPPGARDAEGLLTLDAFGPLFARLAIRHETVERTPPPPLYARIMGERFASLPPLLRALHSVNRDGGAQGQAQVRRGAHPLARLVAAVMRFPPPGTHDLHVAFSTGRACEVWTRDFGGHRFSSELREDRGRLVERFGPFRFRFDLPSDTSGLRMITRGWTTFGVPLPLFLAPRTQAREWQEDGRFRFDVRIALPLIGLLVQYRGALRPAA